MGGAKEIRTPDPLHAMEMRYQLRHSPEGKLDLIGHALSTTLVMRCGAKEIRTPDPLHAMEMRYQLRHSPEY